MKRFSFYNSIISLYNISTDFPHIPMILFLTWFNLYIPWSKLYLRTQILPFHKIFKIGFTECIRNPGVVKWLFLGRIWPVLSYATKSGEARSWPEICFSLKPNHHSLVNLSKSTPCAKDCGPHNRACKYGGERLRGSQFLAHAVWYFLSYN